MLDSIRGLFSTQLSFYDEVPTRKQLTTQSPQLISQKSSILEVRLGSKYTMSIELLLDRFDQSNNFRKKSKKKFRDTQQLTPQHPKDVLWRSFRGRPDKALGCPGSMSQGHALDVRLGRPLDAISGRPRDGQIGSLREVLEKLEWDVPETSSGPIFAGWVKPKKLGLLCYSVQVLLTILFYHNFSPFSSLLTLLFNSCINWTNF